MSKVANTYLNRSTKSKPRSRRSKKKGKNGSTPQWFVFTVIVSITFLLCLAINFRALFELKEVSDENAVLNAEIEKLTTENSILLKEAKDLKHDPQTIAREARKIGMSRPNEKVLVPIK